MNRAVKSQKLPALFVLICFLSSELFRPAGVMAAMPLPITEVAAAAAFQLELPPELGTVEMLVSGQGPTVIHIQEAHGDYESQLKIESILHFLKDRYGVDLLLLEGNAFQLHTELLDFFPGREDLNRNILEDLAKKNLASGPEFFLQKSPETQAWGIEDAGQYRENGQAFIHVLTQRTKTESFVNAMDLQIERLTSPYLNKDLRQYLKRLAGFEGGITPFEAWIIELKDFAVKYLQKDITSPALQLEWPMLVRLFVLKEFEKRLDLNAFQKERPAFLEVIKTIPDSVFAGVKSHLESSLSQSRLPDPDTSILFENMVAALPADFDYSRFPNVTLFIGHLILQSELKGERLFDEMTRLSDLVADKLAADPREKEITGLLKKHRLLKRLFNLELTAKDYEQIQKVEGGRSKVEGKNNEQKSVILSTAQQAKNPAFLASTFDLQPSTFIKEFEHLNSDKLVKDYQFEHMDEVDALYERSLDFYRGAQERDGTMLRKIEERIESSGKNSAAVITGGFHAGPFKAFFESKGYNYALITPKMSRVAPQSHEAYVGSVLANYIAPLQPESATYRPMAFTLNTPDEMTAQGGNAAVISRSFRSTMVKLAMAVGLPEAEVRSSLHRRRSLARGLATVAAKSEVRTAQNNRELLIYLRKAVAPLNEDLRQLGSSVRPNERPILRGRISTILGEAGRARPNIAAALKAIQEIYELSAAAKSVKPKNDAEAGLYEQLRSDLARLESTGFKQRLGRADVLFTSLSPEVAFQSLQSQVNAWASQLSGIALQPAKSALEKLGKDFTSENYYDAVQKVYAMAAEQYPPAQTGENPAEHALVLQTLGLMPEVLVGFLSLSEFVKNIPANGRAFQFNQTYSVEARRAPGIAPRYLSEPAMIQQEAYRMLAEKWLSAQQSLFSGNRTETLQALDSLSKWLSVGTDGQPWVSQDLVISPLIDAANALRSEVRMDRRKFLRQVSVAAFALTTGFAVAGDERSDENSPLLPEFTPEKRQLERAKEIFKLAQKKKIDVTAVETEGLGNAVKGFSEDDGLEPLLQKMSDSQIETHFAWRRLIMTVAADIVLKGFDASHKLEQRKDVGELARRLQLLKPEEILQAAGVLGTPEFSKRDVRKLILYRDSSFFLHHFLRALIKEKLNTGKSGYFGNILMPDMLKMPLDEYLPPEARKNGVKLGTAEADTERKKLIYHIATAVFDMESDATARLDNGQTSDDESTSGAIPRFTQSDADWHIDHLWKDSNKPLSEIIEHVGVKKVAQSVARRHVEDFMLALLGQLRDEQKAYVTALNGKKLFPAQIRPSQVQHMASKFVEKPLEWGELGYIEGELQKLYAKYKELQNKREGMTEQDYKDFQTEQERKNQEFQAIVIHSLAKQNPKLGEEQFGNVAKMLASIPNQQRHLNHFVIENLGFFEDENKPKNLNKLVDLLMVRRSLVADIDADKDIKKADKDRLKALVKKIHAGNPRRFAFLTSRSEVRANDSWRNYLGATALILTTLGYGVATEAAGPKTKTTANKLATAQQPAVETNPFLLQTADLPDYTLESMSQPAHTLTAVEIESLLERSKFGERVSGTWTEINRSGRVGAPKKAPIIQFTDTKRLASAIDIALDLEKNALDLQELANETAKLAADPAATAAQKIAADEAFGKAQAAQAKARKSALETLGLPANQQRTIAGLIRTIELGRIARMSAAIIVREGANSHRPFKTLTSADIADIDKDVWQLLGEPDLNHVDIEPLFAPFYAADMTQLASAPLTIFDLMADSRVRRALYGATDAETTLLKSLAEKKVNPDELDPKIQAVNAFGFTHTAALRTDVYGLLAAAQLKGVETLPSEVFGLIPPVTPADTSYHVAHLLEYFEKNQPGKPKSEFKLRDVAAFFASWKLLYAGTTRLSVEQSAQFKGRPIKRIEPGVPGYFLTDAFFRLNARYYAEVEKVNKVLASSEGDAGQKNQAITDFYKFLEEYTGQSEKLLKEFQDEILKANGLSRSEVRAAPRDLKSGRFPLLTTLGIGFALVWSQFGVADEGVKTSKAQQAAAVSRSDDAKEAMAKKIYDWADDKAGKDKNIKDLTFRSEKAITEDLWQDFNGGAVGFTMEDARALEAKGFTSESIVKKHILWWRLIMDLAAKNARDYETGKDKNGVSSLDPLTQEKIRNIAAILMTVKPGDILSASLTGTPVFTEADLDKLKLYKTPGHFLNAFAEALVRQYMGGANKDFYKDILRAEVLDSDFLDYVPPGERAEVEALKQTIATDPLNEEKKKLLSDKMMKIREDLVYQLATVIFGMHHMELTPLIFDRGDASFLANGDWSARPKTIREFIAYLAYRRSAQLFIANTADQLVLDMYLAMPAGMRAKHGLTKEAVAAVKSKRFEVLMDALFRDFLETPNPKEADEVAEYQKLKAKMSGTLAVELEQIQRMAKMLKELSESGGMLDAREFYEFNVEYSKVLAEQQAHVVLILTEVNERLLAEGIGGAPREIPWINRWEATVRKIGPHPYIIERLVGTKPRIEMLKADIAGGKAPMFMAIYGQHPGFLDWEWAAYPKIRLQRQAHGFMGNQDVSQEVRDLFKLFIDAPNNGKIWSNLKTRISKTAKRSEVRSAAGNVQSLILMAAILMSGVYPVRTPKDVVAGELAKKPIPAVTVTARPSLTDRVQESLDGLDEVRALLVEFATANQPMQVINDFQNQESRPDAKALLDLVLLAQQLPSLRVAVTLQGMTGQEYDALSQSLSRLAQRKLGVSLDGLANFKLSVYGMDQTPAAALGGYLGGEVPTIILSNNKDVVERTGFLVGEAVVESRLRVFVDEETARGGAVWAAISAFLDKKTLDALDRLEVLKATSFAGRLSARLQSQLKALKAFMSAA